MNGLSDKYAIVGTGKSRLGQVGANSLSLLEEAIKNALENDPQVKEYATLAADVLGGEITLVAPAGFSQKFTALLKAMPSLGAATFVARASGPGGASGPPKEMLPVMESIADLDLPPVIFSLKAGKHKDTLKALIGQAVSQIPGDVMSKLEEGKFEAGGASFESITVKVNKVTIEETPRP